MWLQCCGWRLINTVNWRVVKILFCLSNAPLVLRPQTLSCDDHIRTPTKIRNQNSFQNRCDLPFCASLYCQSDAANCCILYFNGPNDITDFCAKMHYLWWHTFNNTIMLVLWRIVSRLFCSVFRYILLV